MIGLWRLFIDDTPKAFPEERINCLLRIHPFRPRNRKDIKGLDVLVSGEASRKRKPMHGAHSNIRARCCVTMCKLMERSLW